MNDLMLYARLKDLGMPASQAWPLAAQIRDTLHPIAHVAAIKIANAITGKGPGQRGMRGLGAVSNSQGIAVGSAAAGAAAGAAYGSVVPGIGTAVGAVVGLVASMLIHTGQGALRLQQAQAIEQGLGTIPSAFVGRQIPWAGSAQAPGLLQFISALMTGGLYMSWDASVKTSPSVNGNWSTTFLNAVKAVVAAIVNNPPGASASVPIVFPPGGPASSNGNFTFVNPGIAAGPDAIAASVIMGPSGLMYWMIKKLGETDAHAAANASSSAAQKVFALMVDHATADLAPPATLSTTLANAPITNVPASIASQAAQLANAALAQGSVPAVSTQVGGPAVAQISSPGTQVYWVSNNGFGPPGTGTNGYPPGGAPITSSQYSMLALQPSSPAAQRLLYGIQNPVAQITGPVPLNNDNVNMAASPAGVSQPITQALSPIQDTSAALLQQLLQQQGANFNSPGATQLLADIAANGVSATSQGPSSLPSWLLPVGLAGAALVTILLMSKKVKG